MSGAHTSPNSIAIIGGGIIGLSCAMELAERGVRVSLYEQSWPPSGASWAAAGMLAPTFEAIGVPGVHPDLFRLCDAGARLWPDWAARLEAISGHPAGYQPGPSLAVATGPTEAQRLHDVQAALADHDLAPQPCRKDLREIEPSLSDQIDQGLLLPSDGQADNRLTLRALMTFIKRSDLIEIRPQAAPLTYAKGALDHAGHDATLIAAGWQSGAVEVATHGRTMPLSDLEPALGEIEPIGGQMLAVAPVDSGPSMTIRAGHLYIVPKADRIIIGATTEPGRALTKPDPDTIADLRARAIAICPVLANAKVLEAWVGIRPGLKNFAPLLGKTRVPGLYVATGHYRNGILLAPITGKIMADLIVEGGAGDLGERFAPTRALQPQV